MGQSLGRLCGKPPSPPPARVVQLPQPGQAASGGAPGAQAAVGTALLEAHSILDSLIEAPGTPSIFARELRHARTLLEVEAAAARSVAEAAARVEAARAEAAAAQVEVSRAEAAAASRVEAARAEAAAAQRKVLELEVSAHVASLLCFGRGSSDAAGDTKWRAAGRPCQQSAFKLPARS